MSVPTAEPTEPLVTFRLVPLVRAVHEAFFPWSTRGNAGMEAGGTFGDPVARMDGVFADAKIELRRLIWLVLWAVELSPIISMHSRFSKLSLAERITWIYGMRRSRGRFSRAVYPMLKVLMQSMAYDEPAAAAALMTPATSRRGDAE